VIKFVCNLRQVGQPFLPENGPISTAFADPPEKNGPDTTDRTKENHQEETHLQLDPSQSSDVLCHHQQRPTKKRAELICSEYEDEEKKHTIERKLQISKVDEIYCVLRYNIWQIEHTSKTILKHVVYVCCMLESYYD
jgi:hypothetical protein